jgi:hypothetical protein
MQLIVLLADPNRGVVTSESERRFAMNTEHPLRPCVFYALGIITGFALAMALFGLFL